MNKQRMQDQKKNKITIELFPFNIKTQVDLLQHKLEILFPIYIHGQLYQQYNDKNGSKGNIGPWLFEYFKKFNSCKLPHAGWYL